MSLQDLKVGHWVTRVMGRLPLMRLRVTAVGGGVVVCSGWTFDATTGAEIDEDLKWGPKYGVTGSHIIAERVNRDPEREP